MAESGRTSPRNELLSCKERSDDSSELHGAGDVGRDSILTMADAALPLPRRSMPRRFRSAHGFMSVYDVKPVCAIRCRIGSKAGCLIPTNIAQLPCAGDVGGDVPALRRSAKSFTMESRRSGSCKSTPMCRSGRIRISWTTEVCGHIAVALRRACRQELSVSESSL